jgi:hypothetical protein
VVGFSIGSSVALEMAASGAFLGPVVLLGVSLSPRRASAQRELTAPPLVDRPVFKMYRDSVDPATR